MAKRARDTEKSCKSYKSSYSKHRPAAEVGVGTSCDDGRPDRPYSSLFVIPLKSSRWCPFFLSLCPARPGRLAALLSFNEAFLFMTPELDLSVTGVAALVAELHRGPVVIGASLHEVERWSNCRVCIDVVNSQ